MFRCKHRIFFFFFSVKEVVEEDLRVNDDFVVFDSCCPQHWAQGQPGVDAGEILLKHMADDKV